MITMNSSAQRTSSRRVVGLGLLGVVSHVVVSDAVGDTGFVDRRPGSATGASAGFGSLLAPRHGASQASTHHHSSSLSILV